MTTIRTNAEAKLLLLIQQHRGDKGIKAVDIPRHLRRYLRPLELAGRIVYRAESWHIKE